MHTSFHIELANFLTLIISRVEGGGVFFVSEPLKFQAMKLFTDPLQMVVTIYVFCLTETHHDSQHCTTIRHNII